MLNPSASRSEPLQNEGPIGAVGVLLCDVVLRAITQIANEIRLQRDLAQHCTLADQTTTVKASWLVLLNLRRSSPSACGRAPKREPGSGCWRASKDVRHTGYQTGRDVQQFENSNGDGGEMMVRLRVDIKRGVENAKPKSCDLQLVSCR